MHYIEMNPVRAGRVANPADYPWSSHHRNACGDTGLNADWLVAHDEYLRLGFDAIERQASYLALSHSALTTDDLAAIRDCTHKGWALGSEQFRTHIEKLGKRQAASKGVADQENKWHQTIIVSDPILCSFSVCWWGL